MRRVLISACLAGDVVRYDGNVVSPVDKRIENWLANGRAVSFCPEVEGGLETPRDPAEIVGDGGGDAVLQAMAKIQTENGVDVTAAFVDGAQKALALCKREGIEFALLKERSPSCGSHNIYDGHFSGTLKRGQGTTAARLASHGIALFSEDELDELEMALNRKHE